MGRTPWRYDEIVLACDLVVSNGWKALDRRIDKRVAELSRLLRCMRPAFARDSPSAANTSASSTSGQAMMPMIGMNENSSPSRPSTKAATPKPFCGAGG
jgi:hypothetical protein